MPPQVRCPMLALLVCGVLSFWSVELFAQEPRLANPAEPEPVGEVQAQPLTIPFGRQVSHTQDAPADTSIREPATLPPRGSDTLSLAPPKDKEALAADRASNALPSFLTVLASLSVVLGIFFLFAWIVKKSLPKGTTQLPSDVVEVLGRTLLAPRQYVHLLRIGNKLLLVSMSPAGAETLTEITDPLEVDRMAGLCQKSHPFSSTNAFRQVFQQFGAKGTEKDLEIAESQPSAAPSLKPAFEKSHV